MDREIQFKERLRTGGERVTSPRLLIFRALLRKTPLTTVKLVGSLAASGIDPATIYRNLTLFRRLGVIQDVVAGGQRLVELTEDFGSHHHHFWCTNCGRLQDFDHPEVERYVQRVASELGIKINGHQLELSGLCTQCLAAQSA